MTSEKPQLHVVFGHSAAVTLRQALEVAGREGVVVAPCDHFSFGPIDKDDANARSQWVENELGQRDWDEIIEYSAPVLSASIAACRPPIAWISPDSAGSVAGFLWWLSHMEGKDCLVLDVPRLSLLGPDAMSGYLDQAAPLLAARRESSLALWRKLQVENAPLRVLGDNGLMSAPIEYFDPTLLQHVTPEWQKMSLIVGRTLFDFFENGISQTDDIVLAARLAVLAEAGIMEWRGDFSHMARCEMRLPA